MDEMTNDEWHMEREPPPLDPIADLREQVAEELQTRDFDSRALLSYLDRVIWNMDKEEVEKICWFLETLDEIENEEES